MSEALVGVVGAALVVDFYDRNRIATWVREHPGAILWLRSRIGRSIHGWRPHGFWSRAPQGAPAAYLVDDAARITTGSTDDGDELSVTLGIDRIRDLLRAPGGLVRLVGLSGVGKTRLAEALFDPAIGRNSLNPDRVFYTDLADEPSPAPISVVADLVTAGTPAIVVIDNCPPDTHRQLVDAVSVQRTTVSLLTIEYDIREDQPEGTEVFALNASSTELIERLISGRFTELSEVDVRTIATFSGGNARVAMALAGTLTQTDSITGLNDTELLRRLFLQRHQSNDSLMAIAQACALVYSFDGETISGQGAELPILGALVERSANDVYRGTAELNRRDLLQKRGVWRAVLPHAIANRLAATALEEIPRPILFATLMTQGRLARSFSRRLGYLADSREARDIAQSWLLPGGLLADVADLNELGRAMLENVAPVVPEAALAAIENALGGSDEDVLRRCSAHASLLRSLAYDAEYFDRAVSLIVRLATLQDEKRPEGGPTDILESLFHIILSGTKATPLQRINVVTRLLSSSNLSEQSLGATLLRAMLKTDHFLAPYGFEFGARSRDFGYRPSTADEIRAWFATALQVAEQFGASGTEIAELIRAGVAAEFRGLWHHDPEGVDRVSRAFALQVGFWKDGWLAARETQVFDGEGLLPEVASRLVALEEFLRPNDLVDRVRGAVIGSKGNRLDTDILDGIKKNDHVGAMTRSTEAAERLGAEAIAGGGRAFQVLLPELLLGGGKVAAFGRGLASAAEDLRATWSAMVTALATTQTAQVDLLGGYLEGIHRRDPSLCNLLLDEALEQPLLARWIPALQRSTPIDDGALRRLHQTLQRDSAPVDAFYHLAYGRISDRISPAALQILLEHILNKPGGSPVALEVLAMRIHADLSDGHLTAPEVINFAQSFLRSYQFGGTAATSSGHEDYALGTIIRVALVDERGRSIARRMSRDLVAAASRHDVSAHHYGETMGALFRTQPLDVLDELFSGDGDSLKHSIRVLDTLRQFRRSPMEQLGDETIVGWCDQDPVARYRVAASVSVLYRAPEGDAPLEWTSLASTLLTNAPDPLGVFEEIVARLRRLESYGGSLAVTLERRLRLLEQLDLGSHPNLATAREAVSARLRADIDMARLRELQERKSDGGRFE
jgi:hypothetical protein